MQYKLSLEEKEITQQDVRRFISEKIKLEKKPADTLKGYISEYVDKAKHRQSINTGKPLTIGTIGKFKVFESLFDEFCKSEHKEFDFADIDLSFYDDFKEFLQNEKKYTINTIGKYIRTLKTILNDATANGVNKNLIYKNARFKAVEEETSKIYLTEEELKKIEMLDLNEEDDKTRTAFLIGCYTGLRHSDYSRLTNKNVTGNKYIKIKQAKTGAIVTIPLLPYIENLLNNKKLEDVANVPEWKINREIKHICQKAGINDPVVKEYTKGGKKHKITTEKWQEVGTHTARRSFATNMYLKGIPTRAIMSATGHKTEKAFARYIRVTDEQNADLIKSFF